MKLVSCHCKWHIKLIPPMPRTTTRRWRFIPISNRWTKHATHTSTSSVGPQKITACTAEQQFSHRIRVKTLLLVLSQSLIIHKTRRASTLETQNLFTKPPKTEILMIIKIIAKTPTEITRIATSSYLLLRGHAMLAKIDISRCWTQSHLSSVWLAASDQKGPSAF